MARMGGAAPPIQEVVEREAETAALAQREEVAAINATGAKTLESLGMIVNTADTAGIRPPRRFLRPLEGEIRPRGLAPASKPTRPAYPAEGCSASKRPVQ